MTNIDIQRLAVDRGYWDECGVPADAEEYGVDNGYFYKLERGIWFYWRKDLRMEWRDCGGGSPLTENRIPRPPKKAQEVEWVDGLPPVGERVEVQDPNDGTWSDAGTVTEIKRLFAQQRLILGFTERVNLGRLALQNSACGII